MTLAALSAAAETVTAFLPVVYSDPAAGPGCLVVLFADFVPAVSVPGSAFVPVVFSLFLLPR